MYLPPSPPSPLEQSFKSNKVKIFCSNVSVELHAQICATSYIWQNIQAEKILQLYSELNMWGKAYIELLID